MTIVSKVLETVQAKETASVLVGSKEEKEAVLRQVADPANCCVLEVKVHRHRVNALVHLLHSRSLLYLLLAT